MYTLVEVNSHRLSDFIKSGPINYNMETDCLPPKMLDLTSQQLYLGLWDGRRSRVSGESVWSKTIVSSLCFQRLIVFLIKHGHRKQEDSYWVKMSHHTVCSLSLISFVYKNPDAHLPPLPDNPLYSCITSSLPKVQYPAAVCSITEDIEPVEEALLPECLGHTEMLPCV